MIKKIFFLFCCIFLIVFVILKFFFIKIFFLVIILIFCKSFLIFFFINLLILVDKILISELFLYLILFEIFLNKLFWSLKNLIVWYLFLFIGIEIIYWVVLKEFFLLGFFCFILSIFLLVLIIWDKLFNKWIEEVLLFNLVL